MKKIDERIQYFESLCSHIKDELNKLENSEKPASQDLLWTRKSLALELIGPRVKLKNLRRRKLKDLKLLDCRETPCSSKEIDTTDDEFDPEWNIPEHYRPQGKRYPKSPLPHSVLFYKPTRGLLGNPKEASACNFVVDDGQFLFEDVSMNNLENQIEKIEDKISYKHCENHKSWTFTNIRPYALEEDRSEESRVLLSKPLEKSVCICNRPTQKITCQNPACGKSFYGRFEEICAIHPRHRFLMDYRASTCNHCEHLLKSYDSENLPTSEPKHVNESKTENHKLNVVNIIENQSHHRILSFKPQLKKK